MKTAQQLENAVWIQRRRENHHKALETLAQQVGCDASGLKLWRQLRRLEAKVHPVALDYCNGENGIDSDAWELAKENAKNELHRIFGAIPDGVRINSDARGHALKLDCDYAEVPQGMERDWGGNGILAAEIN